MNKRKKKELSSGAIAILGSGETSPNLLSVHREMINRLKKVSNPLIVNSPFGFQENVNELSDKLAKFFNTSLNIDTQILSYKSPNEIDTVEYFKCLQRIDKSNFIFAGPGSPSYAIKIWANTEFPKSFKKVLENDGSLVFSSAAATTLGEYALPVYEIYKVGQDPYWINGLDILSAFGIKASVVPHFNNKEGGNHDTRFCYMGEARFNNLRSQINSNIIGIDEHTGLIINGETSTGEVYGIGMVTLIKGEKKQQYSAGDTISFDEFTIIEDNKVVPIIKDVEGTIPISNIDEVSDIITENGIDHKSINKMLGKIKINLEDLEDKIKIIDPLIDLILEVRRNIRLEGKFELSDLIRDQLEKLNIEINDNEASTDWRFKA